MSESIMQTGKECYLCRALYGQCATLPDTSLEMHHIFPGTANRAKSEKYGLKVWLCADHHRTGPRAVHRNRETMMILKGAGQIKFEQTHTRDEFIKEFGRSVL